MSSAERATAVETLRWPDQNRHAAALEALRAGRGVVGVTSNTVPRELIAAAGFFPLVLSPPREAVTVPAAMPSTRYMEDAFDARTRELFDFLVSGQGAFLKAVIIPRTSEREHKLFLYLKEIQRQQQPPTLPPVFLYNLLHTRTEESRGYSFDRTVGLKHFLEKLSGAKIGDDALYAAITAGNAARTAARRLQQLREGAETKLYGSEATALLRARYFLDAAEFAAMAIRAAGEIEARPPLGGPRVIIKGSPLAHSAMHAEIEAHGAIVIGEDDPWGARSATQDLATNGDPLAAIAEHYFAHETSPRILPLPDADRWFHENVRRVEGVVFYLPPEDDVIGWDYPRHRQFLEGLGIPHTLVRPDIGKWNAEARQALAGFLAALPQRQVRHA